MINHQKRRPSFRHMVISKSKARQQEKLKRYLHRFVVWINSGRGVKVMEIIQDFGDCVSFAKLALISIRMDTEEGCNTYLIAFISQNVNTAICRPK